MTDPETPDLPDQLNDFAYVIPMERFVYRRDNRWAINESVSKEGITNHLLCIGWGTDEVAEILNSRTYNKAHGIELMPNHGPYYSAPDGREYLNVWVPPTLVATEGEWPTILRILDWLTDGDEEGVRWLCHWLALKVQNPAIVPKIAVVFSTKPAGGKGTIGKILMQMLGTENCAIIENDGLSTRFNSRWAEKLFVLADEVMTTESGKDVSSKLKVLIDGESIELEGKGTNQREVKNRLAWMFASNDEMAPVLIEHGDRRYSVFTNSRDTPADYYAMLQDNWETDKVTPTKEFAAEIAAFYHDLLTLEVDRKFVSKPYINKAREDLIQVSLAGHKLFFQYVADSGLAALLDRVVVHGDWSMSRNRADWDFGDRIAAAVVYQCYVLFCKESGMKPMKMVKFGHAVAKQAGWAVERVGPKRVTCYKVPQLTASSAT